MQRRVLAGAETVTDPGGGHNGKVGSPNVCRERERERDRDRERERELRGCNRERGWFIDDGGVLGVECVCVSVCVCECVCVC